VKVKINGKHSFTLDKLQLISALRLAGLTDVPDNAEFSVEVQGERCSAEVSDATPLVVSWTEEREIGS
jgi:hypothetical protein